MAPTTTSTGTAANKQTNTAASNQAPAAASKQSAATNSQSASPDDGGSHIIARGQCGGPDYRSGAMLPPEAFSGYPGDGYTRPGPVPSFMPQGEQGGPCGAPLPTATFGPWRPAGATCPWPPDEYLCDGGDHPPGIHVRQDFQIDGLQPEDTIVHFDTIDGQTGVVASNRVCIYAPRFASVRKVDVTHDDDQFEQVNKLNEPIALHQEDLAELAASSEQPEQAIGAVGARPTIALVEKQKGIDLTNEQGAAAVFDRLKPYEDFSLMHSGIVAENDLALLAQRVAAAIAWTGDQALEVELNDREAIAVEGNDRAEAIFAVDVPNHPRLQVCKIASADNAKPGETVDFTIRFDNVGDQKIGNVTIVDSLTTRLEFVPESAQASVKAKFITSHNEAGSLVLRWELTDPLPAGAGGVVRFQCKVR